MQDANHQQGQQGYTIKKKENRNKISGKMYWTGEMNIITCSEGKGAFYVYKTRESLLLRELNVEFKSIHELLGTIQYTNDFKCIDSLVCVTYSILSL